MYEFLPPRMQSGERGNVLLFSMIVMSTVILGSVALSSLIISALQQTRLMDDSIVAYYAAESGVEDALYISRKTDEVAESTAAPFVLENGAEWTREVTKGKDILYFEIAKDEVREIALYDPDDVLAATNIARVAVEWEDSCDGCTLVRATMIGWNPGAPIAWEANATTFTYSGGVANISLGSPAKLYKLRIRAMNNDLESMSVRAYDAGGVQLPLPGRIQVTATGQSADVRQTLRVAMPRRTPLTGIFDFVVFSECSLIKGGSALCL